MSPYNPEHSDPYPHHKAPEPPPITGRRSFLRWLIHGMGLIMAAIVGIPAVAYLIDPRHRVSGAGNFKDVVRLSQLPVGEPREFAIRETVRDAWTLRPNEAVGRVFLVRQNADAAHPSVVAFTTTCPHLGCSINFTGNTQPGQTAFLCPCHHGQFQINGQRIEGTAENPSPRNMDDLAVHLRLIPGEEDQMVQVEFKKFKASVPEKIET
jgi:menaquinol-cytochrome c reductase iron-sulfur subunit